jgi:hypothetical protein
MKHTETGSRNLLPAFVGALAIVFALFGGEVATASPQASSQPDYSAGSTLAPYSSGSAISSAALYSPAIHVHLKSGTPTPQSVGSGWKLFGGTYFLRGDYAQIGKSRLVMQSSDGNLVLYDETGHARWSTQTGGKSATTATFQPDGNFVVYNSSTWLWQSHTCCHTGYYLLVQGDGNVVIYNSAGGAVWDTHTSH